MTKGPIPANERFGLSRSEAACYIGISPCTFDKLVNDGRMPKPKKMGERNVWSRPDIEKAFGELSEEGQSAKAVKPIRVFGASV
jgi:predicted DNA-binding transcriptional regulator AlpA